MRIAKVIVIFARRPMLLMGVMQYAHHKRPEGVEIDPVMYTKSNRKSASANSLVWFQPYFCFRFRLQGLPNAIFRRFSTFRRRLARLVPQPMLGVPFMGTLPVGVTSPTTPTTPSVKEYQTRLRALGCTSCYIPAISHHTFSKISRLTKYRFS